MKMYIFFSEDDITIIWLAPGFGMVLGDFEQLFNFVQGGSVVPISARFPAPDPVPEEPELVRSPSSEDLLSVLHRVSQFDARHAVKTKADLFKENAEAKARAKEEERRARDRDEERRARDRDGQARENRRRERSPPDSASSSEPPSKRRPSRSIIVEK
jgi:hypothetical protein